MEHRILKSEKEYNDFCYLHKNKYLTRPSKYPTIAILYYDTPKVEWSKTGLKLTEMYSVEYLYPDEIQKELFNDEFNELVKS